MNDWLDRITKELGIDGQLSDDDAEALLKIARIAAHTSDDRRSAPLLTYLVGRSGASPEKILEDLQRSS
ncbi:MAG TPA: DUF6457 domain-containing protein [Gaiellaceae bacterium]|jgi:hypothetical protein|nr:DUF6457 domain-containing protein [Gaiellaceae bacterium]